MGRRIVKLHKSGQLLDFIKRLNTIHRRGCEILREPVAKKSRTRDHRRVRLAISQDVTARRGTRAGLKETDVDTSYCPGRVCVYNVKFSPNGTTLCSGLYQNKASDAKIDTPSLSFYIGSPLGFYFIKRRLRLQKCGFTVGPVTYHFLKILFGLNINKVVYNDALDLASVIKKYFRIHVRNILDLSYLHVTQDNRLKMTTSIAMFEELTKFKMHRCLHRICEGNVRYPHFYRLALKHLALADHVTRHLLSKQGHSEDSWKRRIAVIIERFLEQKPKVFYAERETNWLAPGQFTAAAFKSHLESTIEKMLGNDRMFIKVAESETLWASIKSKSYVERSALLNVNAFVISRIHNTIKPLHAVVDRDAFHQLADLDIGDAIEIVPTKNEKGQVCLTNLYDRVCCKATRLHGDALLYNLRTGKLVPSVTRRQ